MKCLNKYILFSSLILSQLTVRSQLLNEADASFMIGKPIESLNFKSVYYYNKEAISVHELKGKWVILDFFTSNCNVCFISLPKVDKFQKLYADKLQFLMIGKTDKTIKSVYDRFHNKLQLSMPVTYVSEDIFKRLRLSSVPHLIWIDDRGIVKAVTGPAELNPSNLQSFFDGRPLRKDSNYVVPSISYDSKNPFLMNNNGGTDTSFLFRSLLSPWFPGMQVSTPPVINWEFQQEGGSKMFQILSSGLKQLYNYAFLGTDFGLEGSRPLYGSVSFDPIFEIKDSSLLISEMKSGKNLFCYSLIVKKFRKDTALQLMETMRNDLENYFGYKASVENRNCKYWKLVLNEQLKSQLVTQGGPKEYNATKAWLSIKNQPLSVVIKFLQNRFQKQYPFVEESGFIGNIDLRIDALMTNFEDVKNALARAGVQLILSEKPMKVVVVKD